MKSLIFAKSTLDEDEYLLYKKLFNIVYPSLPKPNLYVYIHRPTENQIKKRSQKYEQKITKTYLYSIANEYFNCLNQRQSEYRLLIINTEKVDFSDNPYDYQKMTELKFNQKYKTGINKRFARE